MHHHLTINLVVNFTMQIELGMRHIVVPTEGRWVSVCGAMCVTAVLAGCGMTLVSTGSTVTVSHVSTLRSS